MLDLPPFDHVLNTLESVVNCGYPMRRQPVISEFYVHVAISKKCPMNPGFTLICRLSVKCFLCSLRGIVNCSPCLSDHLRGVVDKLYAL